MNEIQHVPSAGQPPKRPVDKGTPRRPRPQAPRGVLGGDARPGGSRDDAQRVSGFDVRV